MTLYIEDLMCRLGNQGAYIFASTYLKVSSFDQNIVSNLAIACDTGRGLTLKQRNVAIKLCNRYKSQLIQALGQDAVDALGREEFKTTLLSSYVPISSVKIENKKIFVKFPYNDNLVAKVKKYKSEHGGATVNWNAENKSWDFDLEESNLIWVRNNIVTSDFEVDDLFNEHYSKITEIFENISDYAPCLTFTDGVFSFANTHSSVPAVENLDLKQALVHARMYGITTWDENVEKMIENANFSPLFKSFLTNSDKKLQEFDSNEINIDQFTDLFKYNAPALIVVPGGQELQSLRAWYFWLKSQNFEEKDISVMFRLDNGNGSAFNDIVKEYKLNNPITENTKVVFISQKLPKPVIKSGINFKFIVNLSATWSSHYSINSYLDTMSDVIRYAPTKKQKGTSELL